MPSPFCIDDFIVRAKARLLEEAWPSPANVTMQKGHLKLAAVLIPVVMHATPSLLLTRRTAGLSAHAGQIAFPGGRIEPNETAQEAALRECFEEVGVAPCLVTPLGFLAGSQTGTGYAISPLVGLVQNTLSPQAQQAEVAEIFEVPLHFFMQPENRQRHHRDSREHTDLYYAYRYQNYYIWGITAGLISQLYELIYG